MWEELTHDLTVPIPKKLFLFGLELMKMLISRNTKDLERTTNDLDEVIDPRYMRRPLLIAIGKFTIGIGAKAFQRNKKTNMVQLKLMVLGRVAFINCISQSE